MAIYKNSYLYHTHLDVSKNLEPGAIQHLGENTLAIVDYLAKNASLAEMEQTSEVVFFDIQGERLATEWELGKERSLIQTTQDSFSWCIHGRLLTGCRWARPCWLRASFCI